MPVFGYKSCSQYVVELEDLPTTVTNELREGVVDSQFAKFRGNMFRVISICHKHTKKPIQQISNSYYTNKTIIYNVGQIVEVTDFDKNLSEICTSGIHYYKSYEAAFFFQLDLVGYTGMYKSWFDNGQKHTECEYSDGKIVGDYASWYDNGQKSVYRKNDGEFSSWYMNGILQTKCNYLNGLLIGQYLSWHENGQKHISSNYNNGQLDCKTKIWDLNGNMREECEYLNGKLLKKTTHYSV